MVRGRGSYRGGGGRGGSSYRGSGTSNYRSGSGRSSSFGNSSYNSSRGSYGGSSSYNYDSRNRDRGPSRHNSDRHDDHKRSYRNSSRDRSSPDRKRSRHEDSRLSSSYSTYRRNESSRSSRQTPPPPSVRSSSAPYRRDDSASHRHSNANDSMGPPKSLPPRSGRIIRPRGGGSSHIRGSSTRGSSLRIIRNTRESTDMRIMRKKLLLANQRDRARRIKIAKLTSSLRSKRRDGPPIRKIIRKPRSDKKDDESKNDEDDDDDADAEKNKSKEDNDEEEETGDGGEKGEEQKVAAKKESKSKTNNDEDEEVGSDGEPIGDMDEEEEEIDEDDIEEKDDDDAESKSKRDMKLRRPKKQFIKLTCVHCRAKCLTFKEYSNHLYSRSHKLAMRRLALRQKAQLAHMRLTQRNAQRDIEENSKDEDECKSQYCLLCRLNYRQPKAKHQLSESHRSMKKFLMPYCSTCHIAYKSPMVYETHRCSLEHIKRKARNNESANSESSDGEKEVDLNNFMTVDSVGEIDGGDVEEKHETGEDVKEKVNVGAEHVKKMEVFYCDLCRYYFQFKDDEEALVKKHCGTRSHLKAFVRFKEDQNLRLEAERIQRRQKEAKEKRKEASEKAANSEKNAKAAAAGEENEEGGEDKIWEDVDKDLGDLLREVAPDDDHEDDEEDGSVLNINIERFDRFKNSEKQKKELNGNGTDETVEVKAEEKTTEVVAATPVKVKKEVEKKGEAAAAAKTEEKSSVEVK